MTHPARVILGSLACATLFAAGSARADLREAAGRVATQWRTAGGQVAIGTPRFLNDDETISIALPATTRGECTSVILVGARGMSFHAKIAGVEDQGADETANRTQSVAGALTIVRCGGAPIHRLVVTSDAGRGAIETIVGRSKGPLPSLRAILPERTGGMAPPPAEPGDLPPLPPPDKRAEVAEGRARQEGGALLPRDAWRSGVDGNGSNKLTLDEGCHRIELFAVDPRSGAPGRRGRLDLDAELRDDDDRMLARDRTDAPDAHLATCVGEGTTVNITFAGSPGDADVQVSHAFWPIPKHLPDLWGADARARMTQVLLARHVAAPPAPAVLLAQGGPGMTPLAIGIEAGACYVAIVSVIQGTARGIGLRALVGARDVSDDRGSSDHAGAVAFCAEDLVRAQLEVDARGTAIGWGLAVFRVQGGIWEVSR